VDALHDATDVRTAHKRLSELKPGHVDGHLTPAVYDYVTGSLPLRYRILRFLAGYQGDRNRDSGLGVCRSRWQIESPGRRNPAGRHLSAGAPSARPVQRYSDRGDKNSALVEIGHIRDLRQNGAPGFAELALEKSTISRATFFLFWYSDLDQALADMKKASGKACDLDLNSGSMSWMGLDLRPHGPPPGCCHRLQEKRSRWRRSPRLARSRATTSRSPTNGTYQPRRHRKSKTRKQQPKNENPIWPII
jgi:hypothetical protein